jgi:hypothetical protein
MLVEAQKEKFKFNYESGKLSIVADFDLDGEPSISILIDITEIPMEVWEMIRKKKEEPK